MKNTYIIKKVCDISTRLIKIPDNLLTQIHLTHNNKGQTRIIHGFVRDQHCMDAPQSVHMSSPPRH